MRDHPAGAAMRRARKADGTFDSQGVERTVADALASSTDDCILWPHGLTSNGYPSMGSGKPRAHRLVCERTHGPAPEGRNDARHSCHVRRCINPRHLSWGSRAENMQDSLRETCAHGHEWTPENTYLRPDTGTRQCRACSRDRDRRRSA